MVNSEKVEHLPTIEELRNCVHMNKTQFSEYLDIPYRTIQNWEAGIRQCPNYVIRLIEYRLKHEFDL